MATYGPPPGTELKVHSDSFSTAQNLMIYDSGAWKQVTEGHVYVGGSSPWRKIWGDTTPAISYGISGVAKYGERVFQTSVKLIWAGFYPPIVNHNGGGGAVASNSPMSASLPPGITNAWVYGYKETDASKDYRIEVGLTGNLSNNTSLSFKIELLNQNATYTLTDSTPTTYSSANSRLSYPVPYTLYSKSMYNTNGTDDVEVISFAEKMITAGHSGEQIKMTFLGA